MANRSNNWRAAAATDPRFDTNSLPGRLAFLCHHKWRGNRAEMANQCGVSPGLMRDLMRGKGVPDAMRQAVIHGVGKHSWINRTWLETGLGTPFARGPAPGTVGAAAAEAAVADATGLETETTIKAITGTIDLSARGGRFGWVLCRAFGEAGEAARRLGMTPERAEAIVLGRVEPDDDECQGLAEAVPELGLGWLLTGDGEPFPGGGPARPDYDGLAAANGVAKVAVPVAGPATGDAILDRLERRANEDRDALLGAIRSSHERMEAAVKADVEGRLDRYLAEKLPGWIDRRLAAAGSAPEGVVRAVATHLAPRFDAVAAVAEGASAGLDALTREMRAGREADQRSLRERLDAQDRAVAAVKAAPNPTRAAQEAADRAGAAAARLKDRLDAWDRESAAMRSAGQLARACHAEMERLGRRLERVEGVVGDGDAAGLAGSLAEARGLGQQLAALGDRLAVLEATWGDARRRDAQDAAGLARRVALLEQGPTPAERLAAHNDFARRLRAVEGYRDELREEVRRGLDERGAWPKATAEAVDRRLAELATLVDVPARLAAVEGKLARAAAVPDSLPMPRKVRATVEKELDEDDALTISEWLSYPGPYRRVLRDQGDRQVCGNRLGDLYRAIGRPECRPVNNVGVYSVRDLRAYCEWVSTAGVEPKGDDWIAWYRRRYGC